MLDCMKVIVINWDMEKCNPHILFHSVKPLRVVTTSLRSKMVMGNICMLTKISHKDITPIGCAFV